MHQYISFLVIIAFLPQMRKIDTARVLFERLLEHFPNCGKFLKIYIEQEVIVGFIIYVFCCAFTLFGVWI